MELVPYASQWLPTAAPDRNDESSRPAGQVVRSTSRVEGVTSRADGSDLGVGKDVEDLDAILSRLQDYAERHAHDLKFTVDDATGQSLIKVIDPKTDEVVRQIPPEEAVALARFLQEQGDEGGGALLRAQA
ncbi:flagellar protein FlaG [Arhodomonas sp. AD133]|uniref:flagellar protein FlaG n=1 Tax=Arhodomonas sp. AD133 TaxID=3415009 RepID=UPI003EBF93A2